MAAYGVTEAPRRTAVVSEALSHCILGSMGAIRSAMSLNHSQELAVAGRVTHRPRSVSVSTDAAVWPDNFRGAWCWPSR